MRETLSGSSDLLNHSPNKESVTIVRHASNSHPFRSNMLLKRMCTFLVEGRFKHLDNDRLGVGTGILTDFTEKLSMKDWEIFSKFSNLSFFSFFDSLSLTRSKSKLCGPDPSIPRV